MSSAGGTGLGAAKTPADFLKSIRGRPVVVKLNSGVDYRGIFYTFLRRCLLYLLASKLDNSLFPLQEFLLA